MASNRRDVPALALRGVVRRYGDHVAVAGVDLTVDAGQTLALLGPNGAGKSTLVGLAGGLARPDEGTVAVVGGDPTRPEVRRRVGTAAQDLALYPGLTVAQNLIAFGELAGLRAGEARRRTAEVAEPLGLTALLARRAGTLSGGEQRRLHTAAALVHRPALVLLDEPTAGADVQTRAGILAVVRDLAASGTAVVYTTHYLGEVEQLDATVVVLERGRVLAQGSIEELVRTHAAPAIRLTFTPHPDGASPAGAPASPVVRLVPTADPVRHLPRLVERLGALRDRVAGIDIARPSLETAYLALTDPGHVLGPELASVPAGADGPGDLGGPARTALPADGALDAQLAQVLGPGWEHDPAPPRPPSAPPCAHRPAPTDQAHAVDPTGDRNAAPDDQAAW